MPTSQHPYWFLPVDATAETSGGVVVTPCPGTKEADLTSSIQQLADEGVSAVVTLMTSAELQKYQVQALPDECAKRDITWFHYPIEDDTVPDEETEIPWHGIRENVQAIIKQGGKVAVHCKGGSGRAGLCSAVILVEAGLQAEDAMTLVKSVRPTAFSKDIQVNYLNQYAEAVCL